MCARQRIKLPNAVEELSGYVNKFKENLKTLYKELNSIVESSNIEDELPDKDDAIRILKNLGKAIKELKSFKYLENSTNELLEYLKNRTIRKLVSLISDILKS